jgi:diguanylate cyclase (GGDEF)-like protein/PAS domain S-box-containing protein
MPADSTYSTTPFDTSNFIIPAEWHAFSDLLGGADTGLLFLRDGIVLHANPALATQLGYEEEELAGQPLESLFLRQDGDAVQPEATDGSHIRLRNKNGTAHDFLLIANRVDTLTDAGCVIWVLQPLLSKREVDAPDSPSRLRAITEHLPDLVMVCDPDGSISYANKAYDNLVGGQGDSLTELLHEDDRPLFRSVLGESTESGRTEQLAFRIRAHGGGWRHVAGEVRNLLADEDIGGLLLNLRDVTEETQRQQDIAADKKRQLHYLTRLLQIAQNPHANFSSALKVILKSAAKALGTHRCAYWDVHDEAPRTLCMLSYDETKQNFIEEKIDQGGDSLHPLLRHVLRTEHQLVIADVDQDPRAALYCEYFHAQSIKAVIAMPVKHNDAYVGVLMLSHFEQPRSWRRDESEFAETVAGVISLILREVERVRAEAQAKHFARHDRLTGLPNRDFLLDQAADIFPKLTAKANTLAAFFIDLDGFKEVNDNLGKDVGDELLKAAAMRLRNVVRKNDIIARLGGDEFLLLALNLSDMKIADDIASQLVDTMRGAFSVGGHKVQISASVGIALYPFDGTDLDTLMRKADIALVEAKRSGRDQYQMFRPQLNDGLPPVTRSGRN